MDLRMAVLERYIETEQKRILEISRMQPTIRIILVDRLVL